MAEEKKSSGVNKVQLTLSDQLKAKLERRADEIGIPLTQYIMNLIVNDVKSPIDKD